MAGGEILIYFTTEFLQENVTKEWKIIYII